MYCAICDSIWCKCITERARERRGRNHPLGANASLPPVVTPTPKPAGAPGLDLDEMRARALAATPGPWLIERGLGDGRVPEFDVVISEKRCAEPYTWWPEVHVTLRQGGNASDTPAWPVNAAHIVAFNPANALALLDHARAETERADRAKEAAEQLRGYLALLQDSKLYARVAAAEAQRDAALAQVRELASQVGLAGRRLKRANDEFRRATASGDAERQNKAGTDYYLAKSKMISTADAVARASVKASEGGEDA